MKVLIIFLAICSFAFSRQVQLSESLSTIDLAEWEEFQDYLSMNWDDLGAFLEGFVDGLNDHNNLTNFRECAKGVPQLVKDAITIVECFKTGDLMRALSLFTKLVIDAMEYARPCSLSFGEISRLISRIIALGWNVIWARVTHNVFQIVADVANFFLHFSKMKYRIAGSDLGDVIFTIMIGN